MVALSLYATYWKEESSFESRAGLDCYCSWILVLLTVIVSGRNFGFWDQKWYRHKLSSVGGTFNFVRIWDHAQNLSESQIHWQAPLSKPELSVRPRRDLRLMEWLVNVEREYVWVLVVTTTCLHYYADLNANIRIIVVKCTLIVRGPLKFEIILQKKPGTVKITFKSVGSGYSALFS